jgi:glycosyltransferase involved in cell wall biosynthesis
MKVIISAVACTPEGGSEGGVGWFGALAISQEHDVRVITQLMYKESWDRAFAENRVPERIRVRFIDCGMAWHPNRMIAKLQSWTRYLSFSRRVLPVALAWHAEEPADLVHQVTYATWRVASPMWRMPIPSIWGPVGGAAVFPRQFMGILGSSARVFERVRFIAGKLAENNRGFLNCVRNSSVVMAANEETRDFLKRYRPDRPILELPVAYLTNQKIETFRNPSISVTNGDQCLKLFAGGNIEGRKGVSLALRAIEKLKRNGITVHYTVAGGGPEIRTLVKLASQLGICDQVLFHPGYRGSDYVEKLKECDIYFLPSFRETTPVTLLEAALAGCLPVVADTSAAGEMARLIGGVSIPAETPEGLVNGLAGALEDLHKNREKLCHLSVAVSEAAAENYSEARYRETVRQAYHIATSSSF